jgi:gas vesicle protein
MAKWLKKVTEGAIFGAVVGFMAGILTAPKSGKQTRADIKSATQHSIVQAEKKLKEAHTELSDLIEKARKILADDKGRADKQLDEAVKEAQKVKQKVRELLSILHEGDVEDEELKAAVVEAEKTIKHLKAFFSKTN